MRFKFRIFHNLGKFAKVYSQKFLLANCTVYCIYTNNEINTTKCLFSSKFVKFSSVKFFHYKVEGEVIVRLRKAGTAYQLWR